jgi:hypothetical protein
MCLIFFLHFLTLQCGNIFFSFILLWARLLCWWRFQIPISRTTHNFVFNPLCLIPWARESNSLCCNPSLGLTTKERACKGAGQKKKPRNHISCSRECGRVRRSEPSHSQVSSHFGSWSPDGFSNLQKAISRIKTHWIEKFFISLKSSWNLNV